MGVEKKGRSRRRRLRDELDRLSSAGRRKKWRLESEDQRHLEGVGDSRAKRDHQQTQCNVVT